MSEKQRVLEAGLRNNETLRKFVHATQLLLLESSVSLEKLAAAGRILRPEDYRMVLEERTVDRLCAYPGCVAPAMADKLKGKNKDEIVFCSKDCLKLSATFEAKLDSDPIFLRDWAARNNLFAPTQESGTMKLDVLESQKKSCIKKTNDPKKAILSNVKNNIPEESTEDVINEDELFEEMERAKQINQKSSETSAKSSSYKPQKYKPPISNSDFVSKSVSSESLENIQINSNSVKIKPISKESVWNSLSPFGKISYFLTSLSAGNDLARQYLTGQDFCNLEINLENLTEDDQVIAVSRRQNFWSFLFRSLPDICKFLEISFLPETFTHDLSELIELFAFNQAIPSFTNSEWLIISLVLVHVISCRPQLKSSSYIVSDFSSKVPLFASAHGFVDFNINELVDIVIDPI